MVKKKNLKLNKLLLVTIIIIVALVITKTISKYIMQLKDEKHTQESTVFYFESEIADVNGKEYKIDNWDGTSTKTVEIDVRNYLNSLSKSSENITYNIVAKLTDDSDADLIDVLIYDSEDTKISETTELVLSNTSIEQDDYVLKIIPKVDELEDGKKFNIELTINSTTPYTKDLKANIEIVVNKKYNIATLYNSENGEYTILNLQINNVNEDITIKYDNTKLILDKSSYLVNDVEITVEDNMSSFTIEKTKLEELKNYEIYFARLQEEIVLGVDIITNTYESSYTKTVLSETDEILLNPGKGFYLSARESANGLNESCDDIFTTIYRRFNWSDIEPEEDVYNWEVIDELIANCEARGKKFAFGIMSANTSAWKEYVTPKWVFDKGAASYEYYKSEAGITQVIPVWTDEIFLQEVNDFVEALGERYNGNETIAFIDIRSYGNWGEQHLGVIGGDELTAEQMKELYMEPYVNAFTDTLLVTPIGTSGYSELYNWSVDNGIALRRDGIFNSYDIGLDNFLYAYGKLPTIFEYYNGYPERKADGTWNSDDLKNEIDRWKASYTEFFLEMYTDEPDMCKYVANRLGYYFKFKEAEYTNSVISNQTAKFKLKFTNDGVAPLYEPCTVYIGLLDENNNLVQKYKTEIDPHTWMPDEEVTERLEIQFNNVATGNYKIALGLFLNEDDENPTYLLGNEGKTDDKWYVFGEININN